MSEKKETREQIVERCWSEILERLARSGPNHSFLIVSTVFDADKGMKIDRVEVGGESIPPKRDDGTQDEWTLMFLLGKIWIAEKEGIIRQCSRDKTKTGISESWRYELAKR